jgi:hypothetical protein
MSELPQQLREAALEVLTAILHVSIDRIYTANALLYCTASTHLLVRVACTWMLHCCISCRLNDSSEVIQQQYRATMVGSALCLQLSCPSSCACWRASHSRIRFKLSHN